MSAFPMMPALANGMAEHFIACTAFGLLIAGVAGLLLIALRRKGASTRFAISLSALLAIFALAIYSPSALGSGVAKAAGHPELTLPASWGEWFLLAWASIATLGLLRIGLSLWHLRRVRRSCSEIDPATLDPSLSETLQDFDSPRHVRLCVSSNLRVPTAIGFFRPLVVFPEWTLRDLTPAELNSVLLHELAHLRRRDDWSNLAQRIIAALLFFHPAVWWLQSRLSLEREMACDDLVLHESSDSRQYAECLVTVAEKSALQRRLAFALGAIGRVRDTSLRLVRILDPERPRSARASRTAIAGMAALAVAALVCAPHMPRLIAFRSASTASVPNWNSTTARSARLVQPASFVQSSSSTPRAIEAVARVNVTGHERARTTNGRTRASSLKSPRRTTLVSLRGSANRSTRVVRARAQQHSAQPQVILVVFQSRQFDARGLPVYSLQVWRLALQQAQGAEEITMSAI